MYARETLCIVVVHFSFVPYLFNYFIQPIYTRRALAHLPFPFLVLDSDLDGGAEPAFEAMSLRVNLSPRSNEISCGAVVSCIFFIT